MFSIYINNTIDQKKEYFETTEADSTIKVDSDTTFLLKD